MRNYQCPARRTPYLDDVPIMEDGNYAPELSG